MILAIRISGLVDVNENIEKTLFRLRLRRKYSAVILHPTEINMKLLKLLRNHLAYGEVNKETLKDLIEKRAMPLNKSKKINSEKVLEQLEKNPLDSDIKPFFRLHPPRGGIDSKNHFGVSRKAVLGDNRDKINDLVRRML
ncbi:MAG: hypothetical protein Q7S27_01885 [Nanoarchaeota archaeon]|nr:hypothetical protein [Nanoarchaeota archaeon]